MSLILDNMPLFLRGLLATLQIGVVTLIASTIIGFIPGTLAVTRSLVMNPKALLFDEPTSALDPETIKGVLDIILALAHDGMTMVVVSHEIGFARQVADKLVFMAGGHIVEQGKPDELIAHPQSPRLAELLRHLRPRTA